MNIDRALMEGLFKLLTNYLAIAIEVSASIFIALAAIESNEVLTRWHRLPKVIANLM